MAAALAWAAAAWHVEGRAAAARQAAERQAARSALSARDLLEPALRSGQEALAAATARAQAAARQDRAAIAAAERQVQDALRRDGLQFVLLTDAAGRVTWSSQPSLQGRSIADREAFAAHRGGAPGPLLTPALLDLPGGPRSLLLSHPDPGGGLVAVALDPNRLEQVLTRTALLPGLHFGLLRPDGTPIAASAPNLALAWPPARRDGGGWIAADGRAMAAAALPGTDLTLLASLEDAAARRALAELALLAYGLAALVTLFALALPFLRAARPASPAGPRFDEALPAIAYRGLLEPGGVFRVTEIGPAVERLTGWTREAALRPGWRNRGMDPATLPLGPDLPERLRHEAEASVEYRFRRAGGGWMWLRETARVLGRGPDGAEVAGALEDISAERELALQAAAAAKFATLGEMAAGLAHELNQPIAIMSLAAENAAEALEAGEDGVKDALVRLRRIMSQADRAKAIVTQLRAFSRVDVAALEPVDLGACVYGMMVLAGQALRDDNVQVQIELPDALPPVVGQPILIEQVLLNLALNARDALRERAAERRRLRIGAAIGPGAEEVTLRVSDSGPGFTAEVVERLFEPFFTTKPPGLGTGLGLSISRTIMRGLGGRISAANAAPFGDLPGQGLGGAEFTLVFRRAPLATPTGPDFAAEPMEGAPPPRPRWPATT